MALVDEAAGHLSGHNADRRSAEERPGVRLIQTHHLLAVYQQSHLQHRRGEPEYRKRQDHRVEPRIALRDPVSAFQIAKRIDRMELSRHLLVRADREASGESDRGERREPDILHPFRIPVDGYRGGYGTGEHAEEGHALHTSHTRRDAIRSADIPHQRVLGGRIERTLKPHKQHRSDDQCRRMRHEADDSDRDNRKLRPFRQRDDPPLQEDRRQPVRQRRTENVRQHQCSRGDPHVHRLHPRVVNPADHDETGERLQEVVIDHPEEVREIQRKERSPHRPALLSHHVPQDTEEMAYRAGEHEQMPHHVHIRKII